MAGIYFHIPFCRQACNYCDFFFSTGLSSKPAVVKAISEEIGQRQDYLLIKNIQSIYFGGGTPSLLDPDELKLLLDRLAAFFNWDNTAEITLEANPDDITFQQLKNWLSLGINRLSIGLQSFNDKELKWMNRAHSAQQSIESVKMAQDAGFGNLSIDLIYGSKFQDVRSWENTLKQAIDLDVGHISSYNLTIEKKTALGVNHLRGLEPAVSDELSRKQFLIMKEMLCENGFVHYEISNFAKPGSIARHNSNYWLGQSYLGFGPSAHSFDGKTRQWNIANNSIYVSKVASGAGYFEKEILSVKDRYNEYVLTRLRTMWGCNEEEIRSLFGDQAEHHFKKLIARQEKFVTKKNHDFILNDEGQLQADGIASSLFL